MQMARGIVLFAHGSRDARWRAPVEAVAARIGALAPDLAVRCAYLEAATPDLAGAVDELAGAGVQAIDVLPIFLGVGKHLREDLPRLVDDMREARPQLVFRLRPAVGETPELIETLARIALEN